MCVCVLGRGIVLEMVVGLEGVGVDRWRVYPKIDERLREMVHSSDPRGGENTARRRFTPGLKMDPTMWNITLKAFVVTVCVYIYGLSQFPNYSLAFVIM